MDKELIRSSGPRPEDERRFSDEQKDLARINKRIAELEALISSKRKAFYSAKPESIGELMPDAEEIWESEKKLEELRKKKSTLMGGTLEAD